MTITHIIDTKTALELDAVSVDNEHGDSVCKNKDSYGWIICLFHLLSTEQVRKASQLHSGTPRSRDYFSGLPLAAAVYAVNDGHHR